MSYQNLDLDQSAKYDMVIMRNRTLNSVITCQYIDSVSGATAFDFSTYTGAVLQVRVKPDTTAVLLEFSTDDGSIELLPDGKFKLNKSSVDLQQRAGDYYYDMYISSDLLPKRAFLTGGFKIIQNISE